MNYDFHTIVIGAGSGGLTSSIALSKVGKKVLLIERDKMGGECTNTGCIPSKSLIHHAKAYAQALKNAGSTDELQKIKTKVFDKVRAKVKQIRDEESPEEVRKKHGVKVKLGMASFVDAHTVKVLDKDGKEQKFTAQQIVIATGSSPRKVPIEGLDEKKLLTNENLFDLESAPKKIVVLGAGAIGCEMAQALHHLGSEVTVVTNKEYVLPREEPEIAEYMTRSFENSGIHVVKNCTIKKCEGDQLVAEPIAGKSGNSRKLDFDYLLMGLGRIPNIEGLELENADISYNPRAIDVDRHYRTSQKHIYAVGDVSSAAKFTHMADDQGRHVMKRSLFGFLTPASNKKPIPRVTYLDQEVASVGLTYQQACDQFGEESIMKVSMPYSNTDRAHTDEIEGGLAMVICKRITGKVLGAAMVGEHAGELLSFFTLAIQEKISMYKINSVIIPYPVLGRLYKKLSDQFIGQQSDSAKQDIIAMLKKNSPKIIGAAFWLILIFSFYRYKALNELSYLDIAKQVFGFTTGTVYGPFLYIVLYAIRPVIFFPATLMTLLSGALFGFWGGVFYTTLGANLSASLAYFLGRYFGGDLIDGEAGVFANWKKELQENSFVTVLIMRFVYLPFDLTNYACGIFKVKWAPYALATLIGILPGSATFVSLGATLENIGDFDPSMVSINSTQLLITAVIFASSLILAHFFKKYQKRETQQQADINAELSRLEKV